MTATDDTTRRSPWTGTLFGVVPYDFTVPTPDKIRHRLWDPRSDRLWGPHLFGAGWAPNVGALAVRAGLIEPDAEDDPLNTFPGEAWAAVVAVPAALAGAAALTGRDRPTWVRGVVGTAALGLAGAVLVGLAVAGRRVEQHRDLGS